MSLEAALDEERKAILDILQGQTSTSRTSTRTPQPITSRSPSISRHASPDRRSAPQTIRSMLDPSAPIAAPISHPSLRSYSTSRPAVPSLHDFDPLGGRNRRASDSITGTAATADEDEPLPPGVGRDHNGNLYDLDSGLPVRRHTLASLPKTKKQTLHDEFAAADDPLALLKELQDSGVDVESKLGLSKKSKKSKKKKGKKGKNAQRRSLLDGTNANDPNDKPEQFVTDAGEVIRFDEAYRKLNDAALSRSAGVLGQLYREGSREGRSGGNGEVGRLAKDQLMEDEDAIYSSGSDEGEEEDVSSEDETWRGRRGRKVDSLLDSEEKKKEKEKRVPKSLLAAAEEERKKVNYKYTSLLDGLPDPTKKHHHHSPTTTSSTGKKIHPRTSFDLNPAHTSNISTPVGSEDEAEYSDIKKAQTLSIYLSPPDVSVPNRVIQTIVRGQWDQVMKDAKAAEIAGGKKKHMRTYLVATDLSEEAEYALEWTFGTIARDGDTVFVMYAVDEEVSKKALDGGGGGGGAAGTPDATGELNDGQNVVADIAAVVGSQTEKTMSNPRRRMRYSISGIGRIDSPRRASSSHLAVRNAVAAAGNAGSNQNPASARSSGSVEGRAGNAANAGGGGAMAAALASGGGGGAAVSRTRLDNERRHALERITSKCMHLLRKTPLQVRVAIEVIHCKNPKHLITEAIDGLQPTMAILGSRGRSALKGVLLGSFSNYLVNKSSVPVMVARKKLRKHSHSSGGGISRNGKYQYTVNANSSRYRQSNNLKAPGGLGLAAAKVD